MKKILFFINNLKHGGAEKVLVNLLNNIDKTKYDITLLVLFDEGINKEFLNPDIRYQYLFKKSFRANSYILKLFPPKFLYRRFIKEDYDIIVSYLEGTTARIISGCPKDSTKKISWQHTECLSEKQLVYPVFRNYKEAIKAYQSFDAIVGVSKTVIKTFSKITNINKNLNVIYNTNESDKIKILGSEPLNIEFSKKKLNIITVGRLTKVKGYERLLKVFNRLVNENIRSGNFHLYILGIGEEEKNLRSYITKHNLTNYISLLGYQQNPYKYVSKADLFVCSSYKEGFSTAVTESLILGTPVITTLCSGMEELLGQNNAYGVITKNTEEELYLGIKEMITLPGNLQYFREKAIERGNMFSTKKTVIDVENLLDSI